MKAFSLTVDRVVGYLFFTAQPSDLVTFVPQENLVVGDFSHPGLDEESYFRSGWAARNARFSDEISRQHLFPNLQRPITEIESPIVTAFLQRLRHAYTVVV